MKKNISKSIKFPFKIKLKYFPYFPKLDFEGLTHNIKLKTPKKQTTCSISKSIKFPFNYSQDIATKWI
jgi:hypothetical protein